MQVRWVATSTRSCGSSLRLSHSIDLEEVRQRNSKIGLSDRVSFPLGKDLSDKIPSAQDVFHLEWSVDFLLFHMCAHMSTVSPATVMNG